MVTASPYAWYRDRSVFLTGHTGFKGSWLATWLDQLGASVHGYALDPLTSPNLFTEIGVAERLRSDSRKDIRDLDALAEAMRTAQPEIVFHFAAQPLVRESYRSPIETLATNILGTAHLLEAARSCDSIRGLVIVTTDKVYENREWPYPYRETDRLGGHDPYSASKAAAEIVTASYRDSFFAASPRVATARAGNVIGGGDWARDRLVPDCLRAFATGEPVRLRQPGAVRPWQHVLEALAGYLFLGARLADDAEGRFAHAWNFGPGPEENASVGKVARLLSSLWGPGAAVIEESEEDSNHALHETSALRLDSSLAIRELGWEPRWNLETSLQKVVEWERTRLEGTKDLREFTRQQITDYQHSLHS